MKSLQRRLVTFRILLVIAFLLSLLLAIRGGVTPANTLASILELLGNTPSKQNVPVAPASNALTFAQGAVSKSPKISAVSDELLVRFKDSVTEEDQDKMLKGWGLSKKEEIKQIKVKVIKVPEDARDALALALSKNPKIDFVQLNRELPPTFIPNDALYGSEWHLPFISAPAAWDSTQGTAGVTIAILDSGVDPTHPDLAGKLVPGYNAYDGNSDASDVYGHGTQVAGSAAAAGDNTIGVAGIGMKNSIMPIRVTGTNGWASDSAIIRGLTWAADHGAKVANLSFAGIHSAPAILSASQYLMSKGGLLTASAGNYGSDDGSPDSPYVISVSATGNTDQLASWSSFGNYIDVAAPGVGIYTTVKGGVYAGASGTSFSSPVAAGVLALIYSAKPGITPQQAEQYLEQGADDRGSVGFDKYFGWGRVNAARSVGLALGSTTTPPVPPPTPDTTSPSVGITDPKIGSTVSGLVGVSVSAADASGVSRVELWKDGALLSTDTLSPYVFSWDTTKDTNASHELQARAYDTAGNGGLSDRVAVTVSNVADAISPVVSITQPANNAKLPSKGTFGISARATDNVVVKQIDILFDGVLRNSCLGVTTCSAKINVIKLGGGAHSITARAYDAAGNVGSSTITVTK